MTLCIGLVGYGNRGRLVLRDLLGLGVQVHVATPSAEARAAALITGASRIVPNAKDLGADVDGFVITSPSPTHAAVIDSLLSTGRPIFVETPLTTDVASARRLVAEAPERIFVMDEWRYHPGIEALATMARAGEFGDILGIRSYRLGWDKPHAGIDVAWHLMPHDLSIVLELLGRIPMPQAAWVPVRSRASTDILAILTDRDGPRVTIEISNSQPANRRSVAVFGSLRTAQISDSCDNQLLIVDDPRDGTIKPYARPIPGDMPLLAELRAFVKHLQGGPPLRSSAAEGLHVVERIVALRTLAGLTD